MLLIITVSCNSGEKVTRQKQKLTVVTTLFPLYDFTKNIGRDKAEVSLLIPPGVEPHDFEPKPADIMRIHDADVFIYTDKAMEPWVAGILPAIDNKNLLVVNSGKGITLIKESAEQGEEGHAGADPHIWLDFSNAQKMVDNISEGFTEKDPANKNFYTENARFYKSLLSALDTVYRTTLSHCKQHIIIQGGHFAFGYLTKRYGIGYVTAYGFSPNAEPSPKRLYELIQLMKRQDIKYIYYEEMLSPRVAETIARETDAILLKLNAGHNITKQELHNGVSFISIMEQNLHNLTTGLQCR